MNARDAILGKLRAPVPLDLAAQAAALVAGSERPPEPAGSQVERFAARLAGPSVSATLDRIDDARDLPDAVRRYLAHHALPAALYLPPDARLTSLDWRGFRIDETVVADQVAALAVAKAGVAESGSLVFETGARAPMLPNFLTLHHIVVLATVDLVDTLEDIPVNLAGRRAHYWVTGVSGTTDIEGQYVRGAHGPRYLHVVMVG
ncbi:LUD domain-containing protein [Sphingomonas sp. T9W2]|uniref:LutC/YkgG family protein n=1 Tax=Sphingomonas sp. T9W2 TaxID=3143183 RepID=UPI0031F5B08F